MQDKSIKKIKVLRALTPYLRPYWKQILLASVALVVAAGTVLALGQGLRKLIDEGFNGQDTTLLDQSLTILIAVVCVLAVASYIRYYMVSWIGERLVADLRKDVYRRLMYLDTGFFETNKTGDVISRMTADTTVLQSVIGSSVSLAIRNMLLMIGGLVMLMITSPKLTGLVLLVVPLVIIPILYFGRKVRLYSRKAQDTVANLGFFIDETLHAIRTVQSFVQERTVIHRYEDHVEDANRKAVKYVSARARLSSFVIFLVFSAICIILWIGGHDVLNGTISAGELSAFIFYSVLVAGAVGVLSEVAGNIQRAAGATESLFQLLQTDANIRTENPPQIWTHPVQGHIIFEDVTLRYPSRPQIAALDKVNFEIKPGQTVALVGASGSGKTTILNLLLRLYDIQSGRILIDDIAHDKLALDDLRGCFGIVPQDAFIFSDTVRANIAFAKPEASDDEIYAAARMAYADEFIARLPDGYDSFLGENGTRLSGGQKQRIAIARAVLRAPKILLLDEATSALDSQSESEVQIAMAELMRGRTTIIVAHRLSTVQNADNIIVLDHGRVVEQGTHEQLMEQNGMYRVLAQKQFK